MQDWLGATCHRRSPNVPSTVSFFGSVLFFFDEEVTGGWDSSVLGGFGYYCQLAGTGKIRVAGRE